MRFIVAAVLIMLAAAWIGYDQIEKAQITSLNTRIAESIAARRLPEGQDWEMLNRYAFDGDAVSQNNLAVILRLTQGGATRDRSISLFQKAAAQGLVEARYNLIYDLPNRFDLPADQIAATIDLLQANVDSGHVPSMVLLADRLRFVNRDAFVSDRQGLRLALLEKAAATGDADYQLAYGKLLWDMARDGDDPALAERAVAQWIAAWDGGEPRAAERLGHAAGHGSPVFAGAAALARTRGSAFDWFERAAESGLVTAKCAYAHELYRQPQWLAREGGRAPAFDPRSRSDIFPVAPVEARRALDYLEECAAAERLARQPNPPLGTPALILRKPRGGWTALTTQPVHARYTLGLAHLFGLGTHVDRETARDWLDLAVSEDHMQEAAALMAREEL